ncbi:hypothetical protein [Sulfitobacter sp.]|uniref:hypothetical protein n=1 Tax=Sulfitobacter sp. TaxID=1903071 RepID=UPI0030028646
MKKFVLAVAAALIIPSSPVFAEKVDVATEIVSCINAANDHVELLRKETWHLSQAVLELPYEHELTRLADGFYFFHGRRLGYHGTWAAFLDISTSEWFAYETRNQDDELLIFAASFVPPEVISALGECNVRWGGFWIDEYPIVVLDPPVPTPLLKAQRLPKNPSINGENLLPPIVEAD